MTQHHPPYPERRELARRVSTGTVITLWWDGQTADVAISVYDRCGDEFQLVVPGHRALQAFYHPYAMAAQRNIPVGKGAA